MKHINIGENQLYFSILRDQPYFTPLSNYYGMTVRSFDGGHEKTVILRDVSASPESYQHFFITGSTSVDLLEQGTIKMLPYGMWYFDLYGASASTLSAVDRSLKLFSGIIYSKE